MSAKAGKGKQKEKSEDEQLREADDQLKDLAQEAWQLERRLVIEAEKYQRYKCVQLDLKREIALLGESMENEERLAQNTRIDMCRQYKAMQQELCHRICLLQQTIDSLREELDSQRKTLEQTKEEKDEVIAQKNKVCFFIIQKKTLKLRGDVCKQNKTENQRAETTNGEYGDCVWKHVERDS